MEERENREAARRKRQRHRKIMKVLRPILIYGISIAVCAAIGVLALGQKRLALREADLAGIVFHEVGNLGSLHGFVAHLLPFDIGRVMPL